jgi:hypothetical protein
MCIFCKLVSFFFFLTIKIVKADVYPDLHSSREVEGKTALNFGLYALVNLCHSSPEKVLNTLTLTSLNDFTFLSQVQYNS